MFILYRTVFSVDHKCRPDCAISVVGHAPDQASIIALMDKDVRRWQAADLESDRLEIGPHAAPRTVWEIKRERWEMEVDLTKPWHDNLKEQSQSLRAFAWNTANCIVYNVMAVSMPETVTVISMHRADDSEQFCQVVDGPLDEDQRAVWRKSHNCDQLSEDAADELDDGQNNMFFRTFTRPLPAGQLSDLVNVNGEKLPVHVQ